MNDAANAAATRLRRPRRHWPVVVIAVGLMVAGATLAVAALAARPDAPIAPPREAAPVLGPPRPTAGPPAPSAPTQRTVTLARSMPTSVVIPSIGVRSRVDALGLASDGTLQVPSGERYDNAGWYRHSPTPGSLGPAVMLGHVDSRTRGASVFYRLGEIRPRALILVTRADGTVATFRVDRVRRYAKRSFPTSTVYGDIDHAGLRLLTCGGAFDADAGSYVDNIVVFASLMQPGVRHAPRGARAADGPTRAA